MDLKESTGLLTVAKPLHLGADLANGKSADILCGVCTQWRGWRCFYLIQGHLALLRLGWHLLVISFFMERCITVELRVVSPLFLAQMTPHSQKRNMLSLLSFSLYRSHTDNMCTQTASPQWMTVWMYLINEWVTLLLCYYDDFSLLCITSCNRGFCSVTFATINTLWVHSFRLCGDFSQPCMENIYLIFQITFGVSFVYK